MTLAALTTDHPAIRARLLRERPDNADAYRLWAVYAEGEESSVCGVCVGRLLFAVEGSYLRAIMRAVASRDFIGYGTGGTIKPLVVV